MQSAPSKVAATRVCSYYRGSMWKHEKTTCAKTRLACHKGDGDLPSSEHEVLGKGGNWGCSVSQDFQNKGVVAVTNPKIGAHIGCFQALQSRGDAHHGAWCVLRECCQAAKSHTQITLMSVAASSLKNKPQSRNAPCSIKTEETHVSYGATAWCQPKNKCTAAVVT
jgi:hypothetical protein